MILIHKYPKCSHQEQELLSLVSNDKARKNGFNLEQPEFSFKLAESAEFRRKGNWGYHQPPERRKRRFLVIFECEFCLRGHLLRHVGLDFIAGPRGGGGRLEPYSKLSPGNSAPPQHLLFQQALEEKQLEGKGLSWKPCLISG